MYIICNALEDEFELTANFYFSCELVLDHFIIWSIILRFIVVVMYEEAR